MRKKVILILLVLMMNKAASAVHIKTADDITYESLVQIGSDTAYTDHVPHFREIFKKLKVRTFLEFGVGFSTKYFLDFSDKVISVEFVTHGTGPEWIKKCMELYRDISNWIPLVYFSGYQSDPNWAPYKYLGSENLYKAASYQSATHKNYALIDDFYLTELNDFMAKLVQSNRIDIAFVDAGIYIRGDMVQLLFGKVPVIVAHDTYCRAWGHKDDVYGYSRIVTPDNYEELFIPAGQGTTVWVIKKDAYMDLTQSLKNYIKDL